MTVSNRYFLDIISRGMEAQTRAYAASTEKYPCARRPLFYFKSSFEEYGRNLVALKKTFPEFALRNRAQADILIDFQESILQRIQKQLEHIQSSSWIQDGKNRVPPNVHSPVIRDRRIIPPPRPVWSA